MEIGKWKLAQAWIHHPEPKDSRGVWDDLVKVANAEWETKERDQRAEGIIPEFDELSPREEQYYQKPPFSTNEVFLGSKGGTPQLVQPGPGRPGYQGKKETTKYWNPEKLKIYQSKEFQKMFKDELSDPKFEWRSDGGNLIRKFKLHKTRMAQLPDGGKGYITRAELLEKLDLPEHVFTSGKHKAEALKHPSHDYKFIAELLNEKMVKGGTGEKPNFYYKLPKLRDVKKIKAFFDANVMLPHTVEAVNALNKSVKLSNMLKNNEFPDIDFVKEILKKNKLSASTANAATAMNRLGQIYQGTQFKNKLDIDPNKVRGNFIIRSLDAFDYFDDWGRGRYESIAKEITEHMPDKAGDLNSFKRAFNYQARKLGIDSQKYNLNEMFSIKGSLKNKSYPYAYFVDMMDANLNKEALRNFHGNLSKTQNRLRSTIADLRAGKKGVVYDDVVNIVNKFNNQTRKSFANTIKKNYPGKKFNLTSIVAGSKDAILNKDFKIPSNVYAKKTLDNWAHLGVEVAEHAKTAGFVMTGADKPGVKVISEFFTPESRLSGKKVMVASTLNKFLEANGVDICG